MSDSSTSRDLLAKIEDFRSDGFRFRRRDAEGASSGSVEWIQLVHGLAPSSARLNNFRTHRYEKVYRTLNEMAKLPPDHPLSISELLAKRAVSLIALLENNSDARPPTVYPEDDDAVVFKWADPKVERLLALVGDEVEVSTEAIETAEIKSAEFGADWMLSFSRILEELDAGFSASTGSLKPYA